MKKLISSRGIANGLRIYGALVIAMSMLTIYSRIGFTFDLDSLAAFASYSRALVSGLLQLFLFWALALALETIVEIGVVVKSRNNDNIQRQ